MKKFPIIFLAIYALLLTPALADELEFKGLKAENANIQESPSSSRILYQASSQDTIKLLEKNNEWYRVLCNNEIEGWMHYSNINSGIDPRAEKIVELAHTKIGCRYEHANQGPNVFDCSGLIKWLLKQVSSRPNKIILTNGPQYQVFELTYDIPLSDVMANMNNLDAVLKPGDVFYFQSASAKQINKASSHAALYVGDNYIIHAKGAAYGVVKEKISAHYLKITCAVKRPFENGNTYVSKDRIFDKDN